ncbi:kinase-like domain-containing protein [Mycena crocata]|nr:kinase-like domain-containing protein [Mycena crocata]
MYLGDRCDVCGSTTTLPLPHATVPRIEFESLNMIPFSESFSGLFDGKDNNDDDYDESDDDEPGDAEPYDDVNDDEEPDDHEGQMNKNEMSYNVEQYFNVKDLDPEWDDDDVEEVMVLSPKQQRYSALPTISEEHDVFSIVSHEARCSESLPYEDPPVTLADFDIIPTAGYPMLCRKRSTREVFVIKASSTETHSKQVLEAIRDLRAPFHERIHWSFPGEEGTTYLVLESYTDGSLVTLVSSKSLAPTDALLYICEIVDGISSLHAANIIHRDLTPSNILIDHRGHIVLSNFCNAIMLPADKHCMPSTASIEYQAPEILLGWAHDFAVDCWSLGHLIHLLLTGTPLVSGENISSVRSQILDGNMVLSDKLPSEAKELIGKCLERNPVLRLTIGSIREHDYFTSVDWHDVRQKNSPLSTRSPTPSPQLRPISQDFPLPPTSILSHLDTSLDCSFTFHTASKAVPSQPRLERVLGRDPVADIPRPLRYSRSMDNLRNKSNPKRLSLNIPSRFTPPLRSRRSMLDGVTSSPVQAMDTQAADPSAPISSRLSLQIQSPDCLPKIFRPTPLDDQLVKEEEPSHPSPAISSPTVCELSPRERMAQFWERLDAEDHESASSVPSLELRDTLKLALPCPPLPNPRPRRLRKRASSSAFPQSHSQQRFSVTGAAHVTAKLRKLRRPLSTPLIAKRTEPVLNLPSGLEQIGRGIGFTYKIPIASHSKATICTTTAPSAATKLLRNGLGLGKGLLRRAKSQPRFSAGGVVHRTRSPPARIQTSPVFMGTVAPGLHSPVSEGPLTPDSITFPPLPEIVGDPFAKDGVGEVGNGIPDATLRLVPVSSAEYRLPFSPTIQPLDNFLFSSWKT